MISIDHLCVALLKERARIRRVEMKTEFVSGMTEGLSLAVVIAKELYARSKKKWRVPKCEE